MRAPPALGRVGYAAATIKGTEIMGVNALDHVNILTADVPKMTDWYERVLGLAAGERPPFPFPGAWLYLGDRAIVHLVDAPKGQSNVEPKIEHFALSATGLSEFLERLAKNDIAFTVDKVPGRSLVQVNFRDCDGNHIHVDFTDEAIPETYQRG